ncbi:endonuclease III [archaeon]|jgi:endonuclease III|nr:endonuclease III [archaeon]MBT7128813.1 endonuclease III [archaeon]
MINISKTMRILGKKYPRSTTTLNTMRGKASAFEILISCLLSLRARDEVTDVVSRDLFKVANTPETIVKLPMAQLKKIIFRSGHFNKKAAALKEVSSDLIDKFDSEVPKTYDELIGIKHVGPKTANIVLAFAYGQLVLPIDIHCHRIPNRMGWIETKTPEETGKALMEILPKIYWKEFNSAFVQFGRETCLPVSPWCSECLVAKYCERVGVLKHR